MLWLTIPGGGRSRPSPPPPPPPPPVPAVIRTAVGSAGGLDKRKRLRQQAGLGAQSAVNKPALAPAQTSNKTLLGN